MNYHGFIWAGLWVADLGASISFYKDVIGLRLLKQGDDWAHFDAGSGAMFELMSGGAASPAPKEPAQQSIVLGLWVDDLEASMAELTRKGVHFNGEAGEYKGTRWAQFYDPEGNRLEIKEIPSDK